MSKPAFSRSGVSNALGKLDRDIGKLKLCDPTYVVLSELAHEANMSLLEFVRNLCDVRAHGFDMVKSLHDQRMKLVAGIGNERESHEPE